MNPESDPLAKYKKRPETVQNADDPLAKYKRVKPEEKKDVYELPEDIGTTLKEKSVWDLMHEAKQINTERELKHSKGFTKGVASGLTLGISENVPGLAPEEGETGGLAGNLVGSALPITGLSNLFSKPLLALAKKSPVLQNGLSALAHITSAGLTGAAVEGVESVAHGKGLSADDLIANGALWSALDAGLRATGFAGRFAKQLIKGGKPKDVMVNDVVNTMKAEGVNFSNPEEVSESAMKVLKDLSKESGERVPNLAEKLTKESEDALKKLTEEAGTRAEVIQPHGNDFTKEIEAIEKEGITNQIIHDFPEGKGTQESGNAIREEVNKSRKEAKEHVSEHYRKAEAIGEGIEHIPENLAKEAGDSLIEFSKFKTKPGEYGTVLRTLETALNDAGFKIQRDEAGQIVNILSEGTVSLKKTMELASRINSIINYETIEPTAKNYLKKIVNAAKKDVKEGFGVNIEGLEAFETAEREHARVASQYGRKSIQNIRKTEAGEKISKGLNTATTLEDLKTVLSPEKYRQVETRVLQNFQDMNHKQAKKNFRDIKKHLSEESKKIGERIIESKKPMAKNIPMTRGNEIKKSILQDMGTALTTGQRPTKTLNLWQTKKGRDLVQEAYKDSPNWAPVKEYLEKQTFDDMVASVLDKSGSIDIGKLKTFMKNPEMVRDIRSLGGEEAVNFFNNLEKNVSVLEKNIDLFSGISKNKSGLEKLESALSETLSLREKIGLSVFGLMKLGLPYAVTSTVAFNVMRKVASSPKARRAFFKASQKQTSKAQFINSINEFLKETVD